MMDNVSSENPKDIAQAFEKIEQEHAQALLKFEEEGSSFLAANLQVSDACVDAVSCNLAERASNACNYGRMLASSTYQSLNIAAHVISTVTSLLCGCVYTGSHGICLLAKAAASYPICESTNNIREKTFAQSASAWEAVKASTKRCALHGAPEL